MAKNLVVDDEPDIYQLIQRFAEHEGHKAWGASSGQQAIALCREQEFDIVIMDVMMPDMDGYTASREIHREKDIPILMLSARGQEYDKLRGFEAGVDDYVVKPFSAKELMARVKVIVDRHQAQAQPVKKLVWRGLCIDFLGHSVMVDGAKAELTTKEYGILAYLAENQGIALTRGQILDVVWGVDAIGDDRTVDWQIKLLRNKLGAYRGCIATLRGVGYKFETES